MTGNTPTVMLGLAVIVLVLPLGLLVLFFSNRGVERAHPAAARRSRSGDRGPIGRSAWAGTTAGVSDEARADVPQPRPAAADETAGASAGRATSSA